MYKYRTHGMKKTGAPDEGAPATTHMDYEPMRHFNDNDSERTAPQFTVEPEHRMTSALVQFRAEVRAGLRTMSEPTDALWGASWRAIAASCERLSGNPTRAAQLEQEAAAIIVTAARQKAGA